MDVLCLSKDNSDFIYADNAATTELDPDALNAMKPYLTYCFGNPSQKYSFSRQARKALDDSRRIIAQCIGASPEEIYFTSGGSESDNWAIRGILSQYDCGSVIYSNIEHKAVSKTCEAMHDYGYLSSKISVDHEGLVSTHVLDNSITYDTKLISIMLANNEIGSIQQIKKLTKIAHNHGTLFHTDAVQALGHIPVNVDDLEIDLLSASAHKFNGPKGIGFLYIRKGISINPLISGGHQEFGTRAGTENIANIVGMAVALDKNCKEMETHRIHLMSLENSFVSELKKQNVDFIQNGAANHLPGLISISLRGFNGELVMNRLDLMNIYVSTGSACNSYENQVSHVIQAISVPDEYAEGTIRISFGKNNSIEEAKKIAHCIAKIINKMR